MATMTKSQRHLARRAEYRTFASDTYARDGEIYVDADHARLREDTMDGCAPGMWVEAWIFVPAAASATFVARLARIAEGKDPDVIEAHGPENGVLFEGTVTR